MKTLKKTLALFLAALCFVSCFGAMASAKEVKINRFEIHATEPKAGKYKGEVTITDTFGKAEILTLEQYAKICEKYSKYSAAYIGTPLSDEELAAMTQDYVDYFYGIFEEAYGSEIADAFKTSGVVWIECDDNGNYHPVDTKTTKFKSGKEYTLAVFAMTGAQSVAYEKYFKSMEVYFAYQKELADAELAFQNADNDLQAAMIDDDQYHTEETAKALADAQAAYGPAESNYRKVQDKNADVNREIDAFQKEYYEAQNSKYEYYINGEEYKQSDIMSVDLYTKSFTIAETTFERLFRSIREFFSGIFSIFRRKSAVM